MSAPADRSAPRSRLGLLLPLLALAWLVAVPLLGFIALGHSMTFLGEQPSELDRLATERGLQLTAAAGLALAAAGVVLAVKVRSVAGGIGFALLLVLSLGVAAISAYDTTLLHRDDPTPQPTATHSVCQEHSGGDTRCPGG